jgi:hypothetical protein
LNHLSDDARLTLHSHFAGTGNAADTIAIDRLNLDLTRRGFVKIDVDGSETDVLESASRLLSAARADVLVEVHSARLEADCIARLCGFGYNVEIISNAWWRWVVPERRPIPHNRWIFATKPSP